MMPRRIPTFNAYRFASVFAVVILAPWLGWAVVRGQLRVGSIIVWLGVAGVALALLAMPARKAKMTLLAGTLLLLTVHPSARVVVPGNIPIYFIDILVALLLLVVLLQRAGEKPDWASVRPLPLLVALFWLPSTFFSFVNEARLTGIWLETTYMLLRTLLSISMFFVVPTLVRNRRDLHVVLWCLVIGMAIASGLGILNSLLPPDSPLIDYLDSLTPTELARAGAYYFQLDMPVRARGLVGNPQGLGTLISLIWPLAFGMYISGQFQRKRFVLWLILLAGSVGLIVTYTLSTYTGFFLMITTLALRHGGGRKRVLMALVLILVLFLVGGEASGLLRLDYILYRLNDAVVSLRNPNVRSTTIVRLWAYADVPHFLLSNPLWLVLGRGFATEDLETRGLIPSLTSLDWVRTEQHSLFVVTLYERGLMAAVVLALIWLTSFRLMNRRQPGIKSGKVESPGHNWLTVSLQAALVGLLAEWMSNFYTVTPHMRALIFAVFGLVVVAHRFVASGPAEPAVLLEKSR